jgi:probable rRNA maturation factor
MTFYVEVEMPLDVPDVSGVTEAVINTVLESEGCRHDVEVNILVTDSETVRQLNRDFRQIDEATDVLSFPNVDFNVELETSSFDPDSGRLILGDIVISAEKVRAQAAAYGHSLRREYAFLLTHSLLHLLGYDHMEVWAAQEMEEKQEQVLRQLGIER